jgi:hypothetical protein
MTKAMALGLLAVLTAGLAGPVRGQSYADELAARVWLDRGDAPVLQRGDQVRIYYRASRDAHVALFHIDTNGTARMLLPRTPDEDAYVVGGRDYRLVHPESRTWIVDEDPGKGYLFVVASPTPMDFSAFTWDPWGGGWDLGDAGRQIYTDPYVAMDDLVALLIPEWEYAPYALDFASYDVGATHEYPRFLCYDCHGFRPYQAWNPYLYTCTTFRVVIWDDPYFHPAQRYVGRRVVWTRPLAVYQPRFGFKERARGEPAIPLVRPSTARVVGPTNPVTGRPGRLERRSVADPGMVRVPSAERGRIRYRPGGAATARGSRPSSALPGRGGGVTPTVRAPDAARGQAGSRERRGAAGDRPTLRRRPSAAGATPPRARTGSGDPQRGGGSARAAPPRRSGGGGSTTSRPPPRRQGGGVVVPGRRPSRGAPTARPAPPRRGAGTAQPRTRRGGGTARSAPPARGGRGTVRRAPPSRGGGGGTARRPPPSRRRGGGGGG